MATPTDDEESVSGFGDFGNFEDYLKKIQPTAKSLLPDSMSALAQEETYKQIVSLQIDAAGRLVVHKVSPVYYARLPVLVPLTTPAVIEAYDAANPAACVGIDVVNVTGGPVTLSLYLTDDIPTTTYVFGAFNQTIAAGGLWSWRGEFNLNTHSIWGSCNTANALHAFFSMRGPRMAVK